MSEMRDIHVQVSVEIPALDNLVAYLRDRYLGTTVNVDHDAIRKMTAETITEKVAKVAAKVSKQKPIEKKIDEAPKPEVVEEKPVEAPVEKAEEPKAEEAVPAEESAKAEEPVVETTEAPALAGRIYTADECATAAMKLRDLDASNLRRIKEAFPKAGIKALSDLRNNADACQKMAAILIEMGAEM